VICCDCEDEALTAYAVESAMDPWDAEDEPEVHIVLCSSCLRVRYVEWAHLAQDDELHCPPFLAVELVEEG
jgi:hypothetical protein